LRGNSMKKLITITISIVVIFLIPTSTVFADRYIELTSRGLHFSYGDHGRRQDYGHHRRRNRGFRSPHSYHVIPKHSNHQKKLRIFRKTYSNSEPMHSPHHRKSCRPVFKYTYDRYGRRTKTGGTMCYDAYGEGYVVPGSRYVVQ